MSEKVVNDYLDNIKLFEGELASKPSANIGTTGSPTAGAVIPIIQLLPILTLPKFDREENLISFWDKFYNLAHNRTHLAKVDKLA